MTKKRTTRLELFQEAMSLDEAHQIARVFVRKALDGDDKAYDKVMDGFFGKLVDKVDMVVESIAAPQAEIAKRYAARIAIKKDSDKVAE